MAFGHDDAVLVDRVGRVGRSDDIARTDRGKKQMRQRVFGADRDDGFLFGIEVDVVLALVAGADLLAQFRNAARHGIAVVARITRGFAQLVHDNLRGLAIGITHAEIDHVQLGCPCLCAHLVENGKNIGGQLLDAVKLFGS